MKPVVGGRYRYTLLPLFCGGRGDVVLTRKPNQYTTGDCVTWRTTAIKQYGRSGCQPVHRSSGSSYAWRERPRHHSGYRETPETCSLGFMSFCAGRPWTGSSTILIDCRDFNELSKIWIHYFLQLFSNENL